MVKRTLTNAKTINHANFSIVAKDYKNLDTDYYNSPYSQRIYCLCSGNGTCMVIFANA